jgi:hypothetical protein
METAPVADHPGCTGVAFHIKVATMVLPGTTDGGVLGPMPAPAMARLDPLTVIIEAESTGTKPFEWPNSHWRVAYFGQYPKVR